MRAEEKERESESIFNTKRYEKNRERVKRERESKKRGGVKEKVFLHKK